MDTRAADTDEIVTKRRDFLAALDEAPATKPELVDRLDTSRSTVDRAIGDLEACDFVTRDSDRYRLTMAGKQAYERHESYLADLDAIEAATDIIATLPPDVPFSPDLLHDAEIECAEPHDPHQPIELSVDIISEATRLRKISPAVFPVCLDVIEDRAGADLELDLVVSSEALESMETRYSDAVSWHHDADCNLYELESVPPYALWVAETPDGDYTGIAAHSDTGMRGVIATQDEDAREWALDQYEQYRQQAQRVETLSERA